MIYRAEPFVFLSPIFLLQQFSYVLHMGIFRHLFVSLIVVVAETSILNKEFKVILHLFFIS